MAIEDIERLLRGESTVDDFLGRFAGCIFDCDGTLVDSMPGHLVAWKQALADVGLGQLTEEKFYGTAGMPVTDILKLLCQEQGIAPMDPAPFVKRKAEIYEQIVLPNLQIVPVVLEIAKVAKAKGIPMAVASGGDKEDVLQSIKQTGISHFFDAVVTREDVENGKPAPDTFVEAARRLGVDPEKCIGFEDANKGMESLERAGMYAIDVRLLKEYPLPDFLRNQQS